MLEFYVAPGGPVCDGYEGTAPVGSYPAGTSPYGALDMAGNVWEWVDDRYDEAYYIRSPSRNPLGPHFGDRRVVRGGSFLDLREFVRCAYRYGDLPPSFHWLIGFRVVVASGLPGP